MTIAFIGHKDIAVTNDLVIKIHNLIESLIINANADTFLFGSNSQFNDLCYKIVSEIKDSYPHIKRIYVRAEYEYIKEDFRDYLLTMYEDTFYPQEIHNSGYKAYVKRNHIMVQMCDKLIVYYNKNYCPTHRSSGTRIAINDAQKLKKPFYNLCDR